MFIAYLAIENFGSIQAFQETFTRELNWVHCHDPDQLSTVLGFLLCSKTPRDIPDYWLRKDTRILAEIQVSRGPYTLEAMVKNGRLHLSATDPQGQDATDFYRYLLTHGPEQDAIEIFDGQDRTLPFRLQFYRFFRDRGALQENTRQLIATGVFRKQLLAYIRQFESQPLCSRKAYRLTMDPTGLFQAVHPDRPGEVRLSETEQRLFRYLCFLNIAEFWEDFENIRDLHQEKKPLLVQNFAEYLDASVDLEALLSRTEKLGRQILLLTTARY